MTPGSSFLTAPIFGDQDIGACFGDGALVAAMIGVEAALASVQAGMGIVPKAAAREIAELAEAAEVPPTLLAAGVASAGVPVPALVKALRQELGEEAAGWLHWGATSQDVVDTALCLCFGAALDSLQVALGQVIDLLHRESEVHRDTLMLARTRGQLATPITFGLRVAQWAQPLIALEAELPDVRTAALRVQFGGASGSRSAVGADGGEIARRLAEALGLADSPPWHTDRSGLRRLSNWLARLVAALGKIGADLAIAARGEVGEVRAGAGGVSSTMPHKSNPVTAEALMSLPPVAAACEAGLSASAVHAEERDGAMWPVEWLLIPVLFETAGAALGHAGSLVGTMAVDADAMAARVRAAPGVLAEAAVFALAGEIGRGEATRAVDEILATGEPLAEALRGRFGIDWDAVLADRAFTDPAAAVAEAIFAARADQAMTGRGSQE